MAAKKVVEYKIGRNAITGRFIPIKKALRNPDTTVVETIKRKKGK